MQFPVAADALRPSFAEALAVFGGLYQQAQPSAPAAVAYPSGFGPFPDGLGGQFLWFCP